MYSFLICATVSRPTSPLVRLKNTGGGSAEDLDIYVMQSLDVPVACKRG